MRLRTAALTTLGLFLLSVGLAPASPASAQVPQLKLLSQDFNLATDGEFRFVVELPSGLGTLPEATLVVTAYRSVSTRVAVAEARSGELPRSADSVDLSLAQLPRTAANTVQGSVQLESSARTPLALQLPLAGLYPITIELRNADEVVADLITFVNLLPSDDETSAGDLRIALAMRTDAPVVLNANGTVVLNDQAIVELQTLADNLDAIEPTDMTATVSVPPALLAALNSSEQTELADRLTLGLESHTLLSAPRLPLDASQAADAGQQALYTEWLRDGDDILSAAVATTSIRSVTFVESPINQGGAALHRDLGSRLLVMPAAIYDQLPDTLGAFTDTSQLVTIEVSPGVRMSATIPDRQASAFMSADADDSALTSILAVADLLAARQQVIDAEGDPRQHGITLATPDLSLPHPEVLASITTLVTATPGLRAATVNDIGVRTEQLAIDGELVIVQLPAAVEGDLRTRLTPMASLNNEANATASMLPASDPRPTQWKRLIDRLPTSAFSDAQVTAIITDLKQQFVTLRDSVGIPPGFSFTLTGRRTTVPIKLHNDSDVELTVRVRMTSSKLLFPSGDQIVTLPAASFFEVEVPIEVRSNGRFPVTLEVLTPQGNFYLAPPIPLSARVNAISGLGNLVTGALLLVVVTWWVRHVRRNRRRRAALASSLRHPVNGVDEVATNLPSL